MARVTVYVPDELRAQVQQQLPGLNLSKELQDVLVSRLDCRHDELRCARCAAPLSRLEAVDAALGHFYNELWWRVGELVHQAGTAEGTIKVLRDVGNDFGITGASTLPLVRSTKKARQAAMDAKLAELLPRPAMAQRRRRRGAA